jgi:two-component system, OmpR family, sensor kinase
MDETGAAPGAAQRLQALERMLAVQGVGLRSALDQISTLLAEALRADKVDVFVYEPESDSLVALGTSVTPMGKRQHELGLHRQPLTNGGLAARVYATGEVLRTTDPAAEGELPGIVEGLGVRCEILAPIDVRGVRRGVFSAASTTPERPDGECVSFAVASAGWAGLVLDREELAEIATREAERAGRRAAADELARLTRREQEVAAAVAEGLSNFQIARRLSLEEGTVANHLRRITLKLGLSSRTQLAVWAVERGLYSSAWANEAD